MTDEKRCAEARKLQAIDEAFFQGDLDALRAAVDDPGTVQNGLLPDVGPCLVYALYHSPLRFIRTLLESGADPNAPSTMDSRRSSRCWAARVTCRVRQDGRMSTTS